MRVVDGDVPQRRGEAVTPRTVARPPTYSREVSKGLLRFAPVTVAAALAALLYEQTAIEFIHQPSFQFVYLVAFPTLAIAVGFITYLLKWQEPLPGLSSRRLLRSRPRDVRRLRRWVCGGGVTGPADDLQSERRAGYIGGCSPGLERSPLAACSRRYLDRPFRVFDHTFLSDCRIARGGPTNASGGISSSRSSFSSRRARSGALRPS